uniref:Uncharacterized protein n=1 Tax=Triticum urartu TaxID=4572 RepID=A0A8R7R0L5_TRIUA
MQPPRHHPPPVLTPPPPPPPPPQKLCQFFRRDPPSPEVLIHPSSRGSLGRRRALVARKPQKEELNRASLAREGGEARMPAREADRLISVAGKARCYNYNMGLQVSITVEHQYPCILVTTKCHTNECECLFSVHLGSGELIWGTLEICFLYIGHDNSSPDILQWLPARVFLLLLFLVDIQEATWHLMSTACLLVTSEMKEGCNGICIRYVSPSSQLSQSSSQFLPIVIDMGL